MHLIQPTIPVTMALSLIAIRIFAICSRQCFCFQYSCYYIENNDDYAAFIYLCVHRPARAKCVNREMSVELEILPVRGNKRNKQCGGIYMALSAITRIEDYNRNVLLFIIFTGHHAEFTISLWTLYGNVRQLGV